MISVTKLFSILAYIIPSFIKDTKSFTLTTEQTLDDFAKLRVIEKLEEIKRNFEGTATARETDEIVQALSHRRITD